MAWIEPITDRTQNDIDKKKDKGYLSYADLNRIESNTEYIKGLLMSYGYDGIAVCDITFKSWSIGDVLTRNDADRIRNNITNLITAFHSLGETQNIVSNNTFNYQQINILEFDLRELEKYISIMSKSFDYQGTTYCG